MLIPPKAQNGSQQVFPLTNTHLRKSVDIGEIATDNAVLEFMPKEPGREGFVLKIDHLALDDVNQSGPVTFHARFKNTEPPGDIISDGQFGPWNENDPATTQVSGTYTYQHVNLGVFEGIAGTLSSEGNSPVRWAVLKQKDRPMFLISRCPVAAILYTFHPAFRRSSMEPTEIPISVAWNRISGRPRLLRRATSKATREGMGKPQASRSVWIMDGSKTCFGCSRIPRVRPKMASFDCMRKWNCHPRLLRFCDGFAWMVISA